MPFYDYVCPDCGHKETAMRKVAERDAKAPGCAHIPEGMPAHFHVTLTGDGPTWEQAPEFFARMERVKVAAPGFVLKGKGWAKDGYKG